MRWTGRTPSATARSRRRRRCWWCFIRRLQPPIKEACMTLTRRATLATLAALPLAVRAQDRPIRLLVGFPAGGGTDAIARVLAEALQASLGTPVIVENKPGAGGQ